MPFLLPNQQRQSTEGTHQQLVQTYIFIPNFHQASFCCRHHHYQLYLHHYKNKVRFNTYPCRFNTYLHLCRVLSVWNELSPNETSFSSFICFKPLLAARKLLQHCTTTTTTVLWLYGFCLRQPGWAGTRRNIRLLTLIVVINQHCKAQQFIYCTFCDKYVVVIWKCNRGLFFSEPQCIMYGHVCM